PNIVFAIVDCEKIGMGTPPIWIGFNADDAEGGGVKVGKVEDNSPALRAGLKTGDVVTALDKKPLKDRAALGETLEGRKPGEKVTLVVKRADEKKEFVVTLGERPGGKPRPTSTRPYSFLYGGQRENVQRQQGPDAWQYGGVYRSADGGETWTRVNSVNPR